jgi:SRSO17 transposase
MNDFAGSLPRAGCPAQLPPSIKHTGAGHLSSMLFSLVWRSDGFREYLAGLLAPRDRNKTLTALAGADPVRGEHAAMQWLQFFLSESRWDPEQVNDRRLEPLRAWVSS